MARRSNLLGEGNKRRVYSGRYALTGVIYCGVCGDVYRRIVWNIHGRKQPVDEKNEILSEKMKDESKCVDADKDHKCDICEKVISNHNGVLQHGVAATLQKAGYKDYYKCDICGKFFEDAACKIEIADLEKWKSQGGAGYIAKLKEDPKSPQTGDTFNMTPWIVLLTLSAMGLCACLVLRRKKN